ncbi:rhamnogalacturonate lyase [Dendroctonus ponderosae]|uniref:rhamnogalacturonan endolyase n=1 Tax=Dendroctonus ponderosae TaxID=77166 RepID=U4U9F4_DENPD|nr:rhamnogalacturonate lyase [Dendroctonus ponderosae]ERL90544.1 hypothetical protein D910_07892 [Dendroctonus ponderosae]
MLAGQVLFLLGAVALSGLSPVNGAVSLTVDGLKATIKNDYLELNFNSQATISTVNVQGTNLAASGVKTFYLDWNSNGQGVFSPSSIHIVEQTSSRVHFYWLQENIDNVFSIQLHYVMEDDISGIYSYAKYINDKSYTVSLGETRMVYRFNAAILTQGTNQVRSGTTPTTVDLNQCTTVQDSTWEYPNGTYYSKYDYAAYIRQINYQGVYGNGFGAFVVSPSREYHGGGPLKQDLTVHQECLVANYFVSGHFGTPEVTAEPGWTHIYGPFLLYFPTGNDGSIVSAVENQVAAEQAKWPYSFVNDDEYPYYRGQVSGTVSGQKSATVVLWDSTGEEFDQQQLGYLYAAETDSKGYYAISNVRPGSYRIAAYPTAGLGSDSLDESTVTVTAGGREHVALTLTEPSNIIWSLGEANRLSSEFKYSDQPRNYQWEWVPPTENTFVVGSSNPKEDWYYAQSQTGSWYIKYQDAPDGNSRTLRVAIAASSKSHLQVLVNGHRVGDNYYDNDHAIYRSAMQSGQYTSNVFTVTNAQVVDGENTIEFHISIGQIMYDTISLQRG